MADEERIVIGPDGTEHHFPAAATDSQISAALKAIPSTNAPNTPQAKTWRDVDTPSLALAAAGEAIPGAAVAARALASNANLPAAMSSLARNATTLGTVIKGAVTMNPAEVLAATKYGWAAGKGAYFLTKAGQPVAAPVASALEAAAPYAQTLSSLSGAQGVNDLAKMAAPDRADIGFLGAGAPREIPKAFTDYLAGKGNQKEAIDALVDAGWSRSQATRAVMNQKVKGQ